MSDAKAELGRYLFYDTRLSENGTQACATCHEQERAFTDGRPRAVGSTGEVHPRGSMSLVNIAYAASLTWAIRRWRSSRTRRWCRCSAMHPVELGLTQPGTALLARLNAEPRYGPLVERAFGSGAKLSTERVAQALASFERTIISARSPYDRYHYERDDAAISAGGAGAARRCSSASRCRASAATAASTSPAR